jgi:uncharacterized protein
MRNKRKVTEYFRTLHHKKAVRAVTAASLMVGLPVVGVYGYLRAVKNFKLDYVPLKLNNKHSSIKGMKIIHISDLHYGPTNKDKKYFNKIFDHINAQQADLIVLTGDFFQWDPKYLYELPEMLSRLRAKIGIYGCLGNHDYGSCYPGSVENDPFEHHITKDALERKDIRILTNESELLTFKGETFNLLGLHDLWSNKCDPKTTFANVDTSLPTFVLSHNPDTVHMVNQDFDLMLSGHSHGGQLTWPIFGSFVVPQRSQNLKRGLHHISNRKRIYINRGLGHTFRMRINSAPEITLFEIV